MCSGCTSTHCSLPTGNHGRVLLPRGDHGRVLLPPAEALPWREHISFPRSLLRGRSGLSLRTEDTAGEPRFLKEIASLTPGKWAPRILKTQHGLQMPHYVGTQQISITFPLSFRNLSRQQASPSGSSAAWVTESCPLQLEGYRKVKSFRIFKPKFLPSFLKSPGLPHLPSWPASSVRARSGNIPDE